MTRPSLRPWACEPHRLGVPGDCRCRYFEIGLGRTATRSVYKAMRRLGFRAMHGTGGCLLCLEDLERKMREDRVDLELYDRYEYVGHVAAYHWRQLADGRKDAKFILTDRPVDEWVRSALKNIRRRFSGSQISRRLEMLADRLYGLDKMVGTTSDVAGKAFREGYKKHKRKVLRYFRGSDRLLVLDVFTMDGDVLWSKLCKFTGQPVVPAGTPFPCRNTPIKVFKYGNR